MIRYRTKRKYFENQVTQSGTNIGLWTHIQRLKQNIPSTSRGGAHEVPPWACRYWQLMPATGKESQFSLRVHLYNTLVDSATPMHRQLSLSGLSGFFIKGRRTHTLGRERCAVDSAETGRDGMGRKVDQNALYACIKFSNKQQICQTDQSTNQIKSVFELALIFELE